MALKRRDAREWEARLVAQGISQAFGVDFVDTFALVARIILFYVIYALCVCIF